MNDNTELSTAEGKLANKTGVPANGLKKAQGKKPSKLRNPSPDSSNEPPAISSTASEQTKDKKAEKSGGANSHVNPESEASFEQTTDRFLSRLESLKDCEDHVLPGIMKFEKKRLDGIVERLQGAVARSSVEKESKTITLGVPSDSYLRVTREVRELSKAGNAVRIVQESLFISLFTIFDAYIRDLLTHIFLNKRTAANLLERSLSFKEIAEIGSIEKAYLTLVNQEVESVIRDSYSDQFDYLEKKFDLPLRKNLSVWPIFVEASQRRHLLVHADARVTKQYIKICEKHDYQWPDGKMPEVGSQLTISKTYFQSSLAACFEIGFKLGQVLQRKIFPEQLAKADEFLASQLYRLLENEDWNAVIVMGEFSAKLPRHSTEEVRRRMIINLSQAYLWSGQESKAIALLESEDWSAVSDQFKLAVAVLKNEESEIVALMKAVGKSDRIGKEGYRDWPLFRKVRSTNYFAETFHDIFGESLADVTTAKVTQGILSSAKAVSKVSLGNRQRPASNTAKKGKNAAEAPKPKQNSR